MERCTLVGQRRFGRDANGEDSVESAPSVGTGCEIKWDRTTVKSRSNPVLNYAIFTVACFFVVIFCIAVVPYLLIPIFSNKVQLTVYADRVLKSGDQIKISTGGRKLSFGNVDVFCVENKSRVGFFIDKESMVKLVVYEKINGVYRRIEHPDFSFLSKEVKDNNVVVEKYESYIAISRRIE